MKIFFILILLFTFIVLNSNNILAQSSGGLVGKKCAPGECKLADFITALQQLIRFLLMLGYFISALVAVIGAFMMMFGGPTKGWLDKGRAMMINSVTYYVLMLLAGIIFDLVLDFLKPKIYTGY